MTEPQKSQQPKLCSSASSSVVSAATAAVQLRQRIVELESELSSERSEFIAFLRELIHAVGSEGRAHAMIVDFIDRLDARLMRDHERLVVAEKEEQRWDEALGNERKNGCTIQ